MVPPISVVFPGGSGGISSRGRALPTSPGPMVLGLTVLIVPSFVSVSATNGGEDAGDCAHATPNRITKAGNQRVTDISPYPPFRCIRPGGGSLEFHNQRGPCRAAWAARACGLASKRPQKTPVWKGDMDSFRKRFFMLGLLGACLVPGAFAGDLRITIPKRSQLTPVQRLNREGVEAIKKNHFDKAKALFYKAYLFDPGDPFTLNNLGYIAELEGQLERAQTFYSLVAGQPTEALIDQASTKKLKGESLQAAISAVQDTSMQINRANVAAVRLLAEGRTWEAEKLLQRTLALDPKNGFTLNNLGVTKEAQGEYLEALKYYGEVANSHTDDTVVVTMSTAWRGKPVSEMAAASAKRLR